mmetsp:Transcript_1684/g.2950  ORF Transcript_1684/g.2950 Transcript_1684/m.2950 type:complete len:156 (+) Transcript_1684:59-526(+)
MIPAIPEDATVLTEKEAAEALKKFVRKNRNPDRSKFMSLPTPVLTPVEAEAEGDKRKEGTESLPVSSASLTLPGTTQGLDVEDKAALKLTEKIAKFDIFDTIDEERIKEFETAAELSVAQSNYKEHKAKSKKIDPNKFASVSVVQRREDGHSVMT